MSKWYNLVVFTASVQEYADPVIDWLESERKFFSARYYRQHCTFRQGAFIKDLSAVEPDLSKVVILDNSPLSYMFHQGMCSEPVIHPPHLILTNTIGRQRDPHPRLDQRPYGQRIAAPSAVARRSSVRVGRESVSCIARRRGGSSYGIDKLTPHHEGEVVGRRLALIMSAVHTRPGVCDLGHQGS